MLVHETISAIRAEIKSAREKGLSIGFVPTMGALHAGHLSLIEAARRECDFVVVSIFVNPLQFAPTEDLSRYPRPRDADLALCKSAAADAVFYPSVEAMYPPDAQSFVEVEGIVEAWEGKSRPSHFRGVTTIVAKLFNIIQCDRAYFGQKDYQQQLIIRRMVSDLNIPVEIVTCPIIRDADGLALSSRNIYLSPSERSAALAISRALKETYKAFCNGERGVQKLQHILATVLADEPSLTVEYASIVDPDTLVETTDGVREAVVLVAARSGTTRLIDNIRLR